MSETIKLKPEDYLMREGEESNEMFYLSSGTLAVFQRKGDSERQIATVYSGELVGEMSFLDDKPRCASVKAVGECELTVIPRDKLHKYLSTQPHWYRALVKILIARLRRANKRVRI